MQEQEKINSITKFARFFIKNYQVSILVIFFLIIGGVFGFLGLPRQGMPEIKIPFTLVTTVYPGAAPEQVETDVTKEIESAISGVEGVKEMESGSAESISTIFVTFEAEIDIDKALDDLRREVNGVTLPEDVEKPEVMEIDADGPDLIMNLVGSDSQEELTKYAELYKKEFSKVDGVAEVEAWGGIEEEVIVSLDLEKVAAAGISYDLITQSIAGANLSMPGGTLEQGDDSFAIQISGRHESVEDIENIQLGRVQLKDIADITKKNIFEDNIYKTGYVEDGAMKTSDTIAVLVNVKQGEDVIKVNQAVKDKLEEIKEKENVPDAIQAVTVYDISRDVKTLLGDLFSNAWQGLIAILVVLFIFISFRSSIVSAIIIPLVLLSAFLVFSFIDSLTLNFLTLYALILSLGIVIDNAIVIVEGVQRKIREGKGKLEAAVSAVNDLGPALVAATATTVLVFVPMMFLGGITGEFVKYIPYTVVITLLGSIVIAFSITPFLSRVILSPPHKHKNRKTKKATKATEKCILGLCHLVQFILKGKWRIVSAFIIVGLLIGGSSFLATKLEVNIWPEVNDAEYFQITVDFPKNVSQDYKKDKLREMADTLAELHGENQIVKENLVSFSPLNFAFAGMIEDQAMYVANLVPKEEFTAKNPEVIKAIQDKFDTIEGADVKAENFANGPPGAEFPVEIQISNEDLETLEAAAVDLGEFLEEQDGVKKTDNGVSGSKNPQISVVLEKEEVAQAGLAPFQVAQAVRNIYNPQKVSEFTDSETSKTLDVKLELSEEQDLDDLKTMKIGAVELQDIATVEQVDVLKSINRFDQKRYIEVKASLEEDMTPVEINQAVEDYFTEDKLDELGLEDDAVTYRGDMETEEQAFDDFLMMMFISLVAIFALLAFQFKSFAQPFIIMLAIPLAVIGVFPALLATGSPISFMVLLGFVVLMGIVVNNSIILIDRINKLRKQDGFDLRGAITEGVSQRTRPVFATTLTTIAGIAPLTITQFYWRGMGTTIISGLVTSAIFVLVIIPVVYYLYIALLVKIKQRFSKK